MKPLNVGVIGYGWAAGAHIDAIHSGKLGRVVSVCSSRGLDAGELSSRHQCDLRTFTSLDAMLADRALDVVSICSYHAQHPQQAIAAARAGKHIICEKPVALNLADLRSVQEAVRAAGVNFCVCFELRFSSQFMQTAALIGAGALGKIHYGEIDYYHGIGPWYREYEWCVTNEGCGSSLLAAGCHALDALLLCMGADVDEVSCWGTNSAHPIYKVYQYPSTSVTMLRFKSGAIGKCASVIDCFQPYYFHTHLVGSEGSLLDNKLQSNTEPGADRNRWRELPFRPVDSGDVADHPYRKQFESFFEAIHSGKPMPLTGLNEAVLTHEVIFAAERSMRERRPVTLEEIRKHR